MCYILIKVAAAHLLHQTLKRNYATVRGCILLNPLKKLNLNFSLPFNEQEFRFCAINHFVSTAGSKQKSKMRY